MGFWSFRICECACRGCFWSGKQQEMHLQSGIFEMGLFFFCWTCLHLLRCLLWWVERSCCKMLVDIREGRWRWFVEGEWCAWGLNMGIETWGMPCFVKGVHVNQWCCSLVVAAAYAWHHQQERDVYYTFLITFTLHNHYFYRMLRIREGIHIIQSSEGQRLCHILSE